MEQYFDQIYYTSVNYDTDGWHHDHFLALDDDGVGSSRGLFHWCGETCTRYIVTVKNKSNVPNKVHVSANTWHKRSYPYTPQCKGVQHSGEMRHSIMPKGGDLASSFYSGERWLSPIELQPGQVQDYIVELNFQAIGVTKDWSVGAWGENGEVEVRLPGRTSSAFPFVEPDDSLLPVNENGDPSDDVIDDESSNSPVSGDDESQSTDPDQNQSVNTQNNDAAEGSNTPSQEPPCHYFIDNFDQHTGCTTLENILNSGYQPPIVAAWLSEGSCEEFSTKYSAFKMELMDQNQITIMFERLNADSVIREALTERGTSCGLTPFSGSQDQAQEEEVVYSTSCSFLMDDETLLKGCSVLE